jgi:hypothetical protein
MTIGQLRAAIEHIPAEATVDFQHEYDEPNRVEVEFHAYYPYGFGPPRMRCTIRLADNGGAEEADDDDT